MGIGKMVVNLAVGGIALGAGYFVGLRKQMKQEYRKDIEAEVMTPEFKVELIEGMQKGMNEYLERAKAEWSSPGD